MSDEVESSGRWKPSVNPWLIAATVALAAFMEVLDTSIANVALPHIAGDLGASTDQGTWVLTSYLVSNAIILPVGAWASSVIGRKNFFLLCITIFTAASFLCGIAPTLPILLISRVLQGIYFYFLSLCSLIGRRGFCQRNTSLSRRSFRKQKTVLRYGNSVKPRIFSLDHIFQSRE